jgi:ribosomal protein L34E
MSLVFGPFLSFLLPACLVRVHTGRRHIGREKTLRCGAMLNGVNVFEASAVTKIR